MSVRTTHRLFLADYVPVRTEHSLRTTHQLFTLCYILVLLKL
jgi:hypothetical protein